MHLEEIPSMEHLNCHTDVFFMRLVITACVLSLAFAAGVCAQTSPTSSGHDEPKWLGTVVCHNEKAMMTILDTITPTSTADRDVVIRLLLSGDCMMLPKDWHPMTIQDPPRDQRANHAAKVTVKTPDGAILHMWCTPIDED